MLIFASPVSKLSSIQVPVTKHAMSMS